jgi:hypothetical protein
MNYISTRYNFTYTKINYVQDIKRKKGDLDQPAVLTQAEIRNNYKKIILGRWKQWQDYLMLICMLQVRLKISWLAELNVVKILFILISKLKLTCLPITAVRLGQISGSLFID